MEETEFIKHYTSNSSQMMWFLGAGVSRTAGMPTATDIIWDLKLKIYCREENQNIDSHDINNDNIKSTIQNYMDSKGYPSLWSPEEYTFYFELTFGSDYTAQQQYLTDKLNDKKVILNIGHRALAGLIKLQKAKVVFTTNFDHVLEKAYSQVCNSNISAFHLEGSYAALTALNQEQFPIYAKVHGDFKYKSLKNLSADLVKNDEEIQKCFTAASNRYGMIITGYSGRDENVMKMFYESIEQVNAFPSGIFWTVPSKKKVEGQIAAFIEKAKAKGINAHIVETSTFDSMLSKIWKQISGKGDLESKVRTALIKQVNIALPEKGTSFPIIRTNAFPIVSVPDTCALIETKTPLSHSEIKQLLLQNKSKSIISREENIIGWGNETEFTKALGEGLIAKIVKHQLTNPIDLITNNKGYHSFYERALAISLCSEKPFLFRRDKTFVLSVDPNRSTNPLFAPLLEALKDRSGKQLPISGKTPNQMAFWAEAVRIKMECRNNQLFLMVTPILWIEPKTERQKNKEFIKYTLRFRFNSTANEVLNAWAQILLGQNAESELGCYIDSAYPAVFKIIKRTAYSRK